MRKGRLLKLAYLNDIFSRPNSAQTTFHGRVATVIGDEDKVLISVVRTEL